ncbi:MAG: DUF2971 domain-containing protein [Terracidiphilus sp.]|jgi:hypothetical protein
MDTKPSEDPILDWLYQPIPEKLWHYTSVQGFQGIIASGNIFATDVRFLNDTEEFIHARKVAHALIEKTPEIGDFGFHLRFTLQWAVDTIFGSDFLNPNIAQFFVASFTDSEDDLSQWRGYSHGTCGASIAFDLRLHRPPVESDLAVTFAPCVYLDDEKQTLIQSALQHFIKRPQAKWVNAMEGFLQKHGSGKTKPDFNQIQEFMNAELSGKEYLTQLQQGLNEAKTRIFRLAALLKHRAFHHEREWRLVLPISPGKDKTNLAHPIRFRSTGNSLVPYIAFPLGLIPISQTSEPPPVPILPVNDVLLGPGCSNDAISAAVAFLNSNSINVVPRRSDVPYRQA